MLKSSKLYSILFNKCPRCHEGEFYKVKNPYTAFFKKDILNENCSVCGQTYEPETGFYYGAMYVSYGLSVLTFVLAWVLQVWLAPNLSTFSAISLIAAILLAIAPISLYYSKPIWIGLFVKYKKKEER